MPPAGAAADAAATTCQVCSGTQFTVNAGFRYCDDCGTQAQNFQEVEYDAYFDGMQDRLNKSTIKVAKDKNELQLTTWEEFNYILLGLVNELINLGAKPQLKLVTLQLWTAYLRENEVAFYSRKSSRIPKLSASYNPKDAEIVYNLQRATRKRRRRKAGTSASSLSSADTGGGGVARRVYRKIQRNLMSAEYAAYQTDMETNTSMSVLNRSSDGGGGGTTTSHTSASSSAPAARIEFSRLSRRLLKKTMRKRHLVKHEENASLECHQFQRQHYARNYHPEIITRQTLFELLYLALNQTGDDIQLADLIRYIREGHLTFNNCLRFLPADLPAAQRLRLHNSFNTSSIAAPSHAYMRFAGRQLCPLLGVRPRRPNLVRLTRRYCAELALPAGVHRLIETLLTVCPPRMRPDARHATRLPHYEGRAVAYVLFAMKLLFGLDDEREVRIGEAARAINERARRLPRRPQPSLFVWAEWQRYVEMRNVILAQCHFATAQTVQPTALAENAPLYAEYLREYEEQAGAERRDEVVLGHRKNDRAALVNVGIVFGKAQQVRERAEAEKADKANATEEEGEEEEAEVAPSQQRSAPLRFQPTLQPKASYLERLLEDAVMSSAVHIPAFMYVDHQARDVVAFLRPSALRKRLEEAGWKGRLRVRRLKGIQHFRIEPPFKKYWPEWQMPYKDSMELRVFDHDIDEEDWLVDQRAKEINKQREMRLNRELLKEAVEGNLERMRGELEVHRQRERQRRAVKEEAATKAEKVAEIALIDEDSRDMFTQLESQEIPAAQPTPSRSRSALKPQPDDSDGEETVPLFQMVLSDDEEWKSDESSSSSSSDEDDQADPPLEFLVNHYDYWMCTGRLNETKLSTFDQMCARMPRNFAWLLRQCAHLCESHERDVYNELLVLENWYAYRLAPFERMRNMLLYQAVRRPMHLPDLQRTIVQLSEFW